MSIRNQLLDFFKSIVGNKEEDIIENGIMTDEQQINFITSEDMKGVISKDIREELLETLKSVNKKANAKDLKNENHRKFSKEFKANAKFPNKVSVENKKEKEDKSITH